MIPTLVLSLFLLAGCASVGDESLQHRPDDWPPMTYTKADLVKELGRPQTSSVTTKDGETQEVLTWVYAYAETNPALFIPLVGLFVAASGDGVSGDSRSLVATFNAEGKLISRTWTTSRIGNDPRPTAPNY